jgi:integrase
MQRDQTLSKNILCELYWLQLRRTMIIVNDVRGKHRMYVFTYHGKRIGKMNNTAWRKGRSKAGLPQVRVPDLKHTFGRRLRAAGVSFEDRQDLLGHRSGRITTHYSVAELGNLLSAANRVVGEGSRKTPALFVLKKKAASA